MSSSFVPALLVIDMTNEFVLSEGTIPTTTLGGSDKGSASLIPAINELLGLKGFAAKVNNTLNIPSASILFGGKLLPGVTEIELPNILDTASKALSAIGGASSTASTIKTRVWPQGGNPDTKMGQLVEGINQTEFDFTVMRGNHPLVLMHSAFADVYGRGYKDLPANTVTHDLFAELKNRNVTDVFIVGTAGDHCVPHTAWDSAKLGFKTYILEDVIANIYPDNTEYNKCKATSTEKGVAYVTSKGPEVQKVRDL